MLTVNLTEQDILVLAAALTHFDLSDEEMTPEFRTSVLACASLFADAKAIFRSAP